MTRHPRGLSAEEAAAWDRLAQTVTPLPSVKSVTNPKPVFGGSEPEPIDPARRSAPPPLRSRPREVTVHDTKRAPPGGLDSHWERRLSRAATEPDFTLDLHGHTLDQAYRRLDAGLTQAKAIGARLVLVVTGKSRPVDAADRGSKRGAIRAKILDWLAAGQHASDIAAVKQAHRRHGGDGALYLVLKRRR